MGAAGSVVPVLGNAAGLAAGSVMGGWGGASAGNAVVEAQGIAIGDMKKAGVDMSDEVAVADYLEKNSDELFKKSATKGAIIGAIDTMTMGMTHLLLAAPVKAPFL